jgi:hypothetical protein
LPGRRGAPAERPTAFGAQSRFPLVTGLSGEFLGGGGNICFEISVGRERGKVREQKAHEEDAGRFDHRIWGSFHVNDESDA